MEIPSDLYSGISIGCQKARRASELVKSPEIKARSVAYARSAKEISSLLLLPVILPVFSVCQHHVQQLIDAAIEEIPRHRLKPKEAENLKAEVNSQVTAKLKEQQTIDAVTATGREHLELVMKQDVAVRSSVQTLLYAGALYGWAMFESLAKDLWVAAVNARPVELGQQALQRLPGDRADGGISSKSISLGQLAARGFDLRNCLGPMLAEKYDFTSNNGMRQAYVAAFGKLNGHEDVFLIQNFGIWKR